MDEKLKLKDYSKHSKRTLSRLIKLRQKQIQAAESGHPTTSKSLHQLKYEVENMANSLLERAITGSK
jgi:hypothetical protein